MSRAGHGATRGGDASATGYGGDASRAADAGVRGKKTQQTRRSGAPLRLHAEVRGEGPPVLVLHGFTGSTRAMEGVAEGLAGAGHRAIGVDLPGHGRSPVPEDPAAYTLEATCDALEATLNSLEVGAAHVLGYSLGGRVALGLAALRPERVRSAVLVGATAGIADPEARAARVRADEALARELEREGIAPFVERWMALPLFARQRERLGEAAWQAARRERLARRPEGLARSLRGIGQGAQPPLHDRLPQVPIPVLLAVGAEDARFRAVAEDLAARLPRAEILRVPRAGHAAHLESPDAFLAAARDFLRRAEARWSSGASPSDPSHPSHSSHSTHPKQRSARP